MRAPHRSIQLAAIALSAGIAFATPLPDPPFSSGGFVSPDALTFKAQQSIEKALAKYAATIAKCDWTAVIGLQLAYTPSNPTKITEIQTKWQLCVQKADANYVKYRDKILLGGTPACLDQAGIDAIRAQLDAQFDLLAPVVYCDADGANPDPVTGIDIPDFKPEAEGEVALAKLLVKVGRSAAKCYTAAAKYAFKFGGAIPQIYLDKIQACLDKYETLGLAKVADLDQRQKLVACTPLATAQGLVTSTVGLAGQFSDDVYCASPSGAFLD